MKKMLFEDGVLITPAKVLINGIEYEIIPAVYEGKTPFSAENINQLQDNIEKAVNTQIVTIPETDLNDYKTEGRWYFNTTVTPKNIPVGSNGWLDVIDSGYDNIKQIWDRAGTANINDFETYVRTCLKGTWSNWKQYMTEDDLYYKSGDTETIPFWYGGGALSSGATGIYFTIPLQKRLKKVNPKITGGTLNVRRPSGGYIIQGGSITDATITPYESESNLLTIRLAYDTAFDETNNVPLGIDARDLKISFTEKTA